MGSTDGGAFRRMLRKLTSDVDVLDADDLSEDSERSGAQRASECACGQEVTMLGRLRSVEFCPEDDSSAQLQAELYDGTEGVTLVWMGRRRIPGIEPGRTIIYDINKDGFVIEGLSYGDANLIELLQGLGAALDPQKLQSLGRDELTPREYPLSRAWAWGAERSGG